MRTDLVTTSQLGLYWMKNRNQVYHGILPRWIGQGGDDIINSGTSADTNDGGTGNDEINSGDGNDINSGGDGDDTINSGDGDDVNTGGDGADNVDCGHDTITDFQPGEDKIKRCQPIIDASPLEDDGRIYLNARPSIAEDFIVIMHSTG